MYTATTRRRDPQYLDTLLVGICEEDLQILEHGPGFLISKHTLEENVRIAFALALLRKCSLAVLQNRFDQLDNEERNNWALLITDPEFFNKMRASQGLVQILLRAQDFKTAPRALGIHLYYRPDVESMESFAYQYFTLTEILPTASKPSNN